MLNRYDRRTDERLRAHGDRFPDKAKLHLRLVIPLLVAVGAAWMAVDPHATAAAPLWPQQAELTAQSFAQAGDGFGWSAAVSGNTVIVGAREDSGNPTRNGSAYVFVPNGAEWTLQQRLVAPPGDAAQLDRFGHRVAISGDTAVIGAIGDDLDFVDQGSAYVYVRSHGVWSLEKKLIANDARANDNFGFSVAISGNTVIIGSRGGNGAAYIFIRSGGAWSQQQKLSSGTPNNDLFGWAVAISGGSAIVGALGGGGNGSATVFVRSGVTWSPQQRLVAADGIPFDAFGVSVGISGDTVVVGQTSAASNPTDLLRQSAYVFVRNDGTWSQQQKLTAAGGSALNDFFGRHVAISSDSVIVGAFGVDTAMGSGDQGAAYVFLRHGSRWSQQPSLTAMNGTGGASLGTSVAIDGGLAIAGAYGQLVGTNTYRQGAAYVFPNPDIDGDSLPDEWETSGVTIDGTFIDLPHMGANPRHKDIFVHVDWMAPGPNGVVLKPSARAIKMVTDAFAASPVTNPDLKDGVLLHVDLGPDSITNPATGGPWDSYSRAREVSFQHQLGELDTEGNYHWSAVDTVKAGGFALTKRSAIFHYALFCNTFANEPNSGIRRGGGTADFLVSLGKERVAVSPGGTVERLVAGGTELQQAGTFMHELGHDLGLRHGGGEGTPFKPNYLSVMNYYFQFIGLLNSDGTRSLDYSRSALSPLYQTILNERVGIGDPAGHLTLWNGPSRPDDPPDSNRCRANENDYYKRLLPGSGLDWDCDAALDRDAVNSALVNDEEAPDPLTGFDDWANLQFDGGGRIGSLGASGTDPTSTPNDELPVDQILSALPPALLEEDLVAPLDVVTYSPNKGFAPLTVNFNGSASTAVVGSVIHWSWDFGDGTTGSGATIQHTYDTPGEYFATLTVTDEGGGVNLISLLNLVTVADPPPATSTPPRTSTPVPTLTPELTPPRTTTGTPGSGSSPTPTGEPTPTIGAGNVDPAFNSTVTSTYGRAIFEIVTQPDGKVIVGGDFESFGGCARKNIARVNADGTCDPTFDPNLVLTEVFDNNIAVGGKKRESLHVQALALQPDGKILVGVDGIHGRKDGVLTASKMLVRLDTDGTLDSSFDLHGVPLTAESSGPAVGTIAVQTDGRILIGGNFLYSNNGSRGYIARLHADGSLDSSFAAPLGLLQPGVAHDNYSALAIQPDGKIIVGGRFIEASLSATPILRLNSNGSRDVAFNVEQPLGSGLWACEFSIFSDIRALALQPDGKIIVAGNLAPRDLSTTFLFARLNSDGSRDPTFATTFGTNAVRDTARALLLQPDSKVVVAGSFKTTVPAIRNSVARLNADGTLDATFDTLGMNTTGVQQQYSSRYVVNAVARHANGKIVVGGDYDTFNGGPAESLLQLAADGSRDPSFESNGPGVHAEVNVLLRQPDGKLLVGFYPKITILSQATKLNGVRRGGIGRLNADGTTDPTFNSPFDDGSTAFGIALQADGKVIVGGSFRPIGTPGQELVFARLNADGTLDGGFHPPSGGGVQLGNNQAFAIQPDQKILIFEAAPFGVRRLVRLNTDGGRDDTFSIELVNGAVEQIALQPDGKIILTGLVYLPNGTPARLARLNPDGSFDATFAPGTGPDDRVRALALQPDGQILIGGKFSAYDGSARNKIARVNTNGSLDAAFLPVNVNPSTDNGREISAFALQPDGKILVGTNSLGNNAHAPPNRVFRLDPDGSLDDSFPLGTGVEGTYVSVNTMSLQPNGSVVIGGEFDVVNAVARLALARLLGPTTTCPGDCDGSGNVTVDELIKGVNIALGTRPASDCPPVDVDATMSVTVNEIIQAVNRALNGCAG